MRLRMPFGRKPKEFPSHLWTQCPNCGEMLFNKQLARNLSVCTKCEHHFRLGARERIEAAQAKSGEKDAIITGEATIGDNPVILAVMDFEFMGGSMGAVVGEKITRAAERALTEHRALVRAAASGGARRMGGAVGVREAGLIERRERAEDQARLPYVS